MVRTKLKDNSMFNNSHTVSEQIEKNDIVVIDEDWLNEDYKDSEWQLARFVKDNGDGSCNVIFCKDNEYVVMDNDYILGKANKELESIGKRLEENLKL